MLPWLSTAEAALTADAMTHGRQLAGHLQHAAVLLPQMGCTTGGDGWAGQIAGGLGKFLAAPCTCNR